MKRKYNRDSYYFGKLFKETLFYVASSPFYSSVKLHVLTTQVQVRKTNLPSFCFSIVGTPPRSNSNQAASFQVFEPRTAAKSDSDRSSTLANTSLTSYSIPWNCAECQHFGCGRIVLPFGRQFSFKFLFSTQVKRAIRSSGDYVDFCFQNAFTGICYQQTWLRPRLTGLEYGAVSEQRKNATVRDREEKVMVRTFNVLRYSVLVSVAVQ